MSEEINLIGYHGTDKSSAEKIINDDYFTHSIGDEEWLGKGIYFFESVLVDKKDFGLENAIKWAKNKVINNRRIGIAVIKCDISVSEDLFLDLNNPSTQVIFHKIKNSYLEAQNKAISNNERLNRLKPKKMTQFVENKILEILCNKYNVYIIRKSVYIRFTDNDPYSFINNAVIICIKNEQRKCIKTKVLIYPGEK